MGHDADNAAPAAAHAFIARWQGTSASELAKSLENPKFEPNRPLALTQPAVIASETIAAYLTR